MNEVAGRYSSIVKQVLPWILVSLIWIGLDSRGITTPVRGGLEQGIVKIGGVSASMASMMRAPYNYIQYIAQGNNRIASLEQRLKKTSVDYAQLAALEEENRNLKSLLKQESGGGDQGKFIAARLIAGLHQALINKGSADGLVEGDIVLDSENVLVGKLRAIRPHVAIVERPIDTASRIAVRVSNRETTGMLVGRGNQTVLEGVLQAEVLEPGDVIVTSGADGTYPPDLVVGSVTVVLSEPSEVTKTAAVELLASQEPAVKVAR